ncbi:MAG: hypothetical protein KF799_02080 [Bdellovibrionales bacterium]|nr:hypothetical protein [Bdellovibrionales bacterium]
MSQQSSGGNALLLESPRTYFLEQVDGALKRLKFQPLPLSQNYLVDLLEHYLFSSNLFPKDDETGKAKRETLAEMWLKAQNSPTPQRQDLLKKLGDSSLYISGFFGDSLSRKIVDIDYYVDMGGVAYGALASSAADEQRSMMYEEFSQRFSDFVDVLTYISQESLVQTNGDLLRLYGRYIATGSRLAEEQLLEKGLLVADLQKSKAQKM